MEAICRKATDGVREIYGQALLSTILVD
jgi:hypothetical protein